MKKMELYTISFKDLSSGSLQFGWNIDASFFAMYEMSEIGDANVEAQVNLMKHSNFLELKYVLNGWVEVACDRCLDPLRLDIAAEAQMYVRFGDEAGEVDSDDVDIVILPYGENHLNVAQYLYEYAHLSLPIRRVHPDDENGQSKCNAEMMNKLEQFLVKNQ